MLSSAVFLLAACLLAHGTAANEVTDEVNKVLDGVKTEIQQMEAEINQAGAAASSAISGQLNNAYHSLDAELEAAAKKATAAGIDISACTRQLNTTATTDITTHTSNAVKCITQEMNDALGACVTELNAVEEAEKDVQSGEAALKACNKLSTWKKVKCVAQETAKLVKQANTIKGEMVTSKNTIERVATNFTLDIKACENKELTNTETDVKKAGEDFGLCVLAKGIHL